MTVSLSVRQSIFAGCGAEGLDCDLATPPFGSTGGVFEVDLDGAERPTETFRFAPNELFITSKALDFTLVAVQTPNATGREVTDWAALPLVAETGKMVIGEMINIVQHPGGDYKQLALRENQLVDVLNDFLHYKTDTAPGSSGSPVIDIAGRAAHGSGDRRNAPLSCFLAGLRMGRDGTAPTPDVIHRM